MIFYIACNYALVMYFFNEIVISEIEVTYLFQHILYLQR